MNCKDCKHWTGRGSDPAGGFRCYKLTEHAETRSKSIAADCEAILVTGDTKAAAVRSAERECLKLFRELADVCGYEVSE